MGENKNENLLHSEINTNPHHSRTWMLVVLIIIIFIIGYLALAANQNWWPLERYGLHIDGDANVDELGISDDLDQCDREQEMVNFALLPDCYLSTISQAAPDNPHIAKQIVKTRAGIDIDEAVQKETVWRTAWIKYYDKYVDWTIKKDECESKGFDWISSGIDGPELGFCYMPQEDDSDILFQKEASAGECPIVGGCYEKITVFSSGLTIVETTETLRQYDFGESEIEQIRDKIEETGVMDKSCEAPMVDDYWATYIINYKGEHKIIAFPGCEEDLNLIEGRVESIWLGLDLLRHGE